MSYTFTLSEETFTAEVIAVYNDNKTSVGVAKVFGETEDPITVDAPLNLTATPASSSSINLTWNTAAYATSYNIYRDNILVKNVNETNYTDEGLEYNTEYCYTVTSVFNNIESEKSEEVCVKTLGEGIEEFTSSLHIFPNPANDRLYIEAEVEIEEVSIYTITGVIVGQQTTLNGQQSSSIDLSNLNNGIYFIKINTKQGNIVKQFIKQ